MKMSSWFGRILIGAMAVVALAAILGLPARWRVRWLVEDGATLVSNEQYLPAARRLAQAVATAPRDARAHYYLGLAYAGLGQDAAALSHAEDAVRLAPQDPQYEVGLAALFLDAGRTPEAVAHLRRAAAIEPHSADIRLLLADALRRAGDPAGMEREYRNAMRLARGGTLGALAHEQLRAALERSAP
jgi:Flp pilus assembly protein TadD